MRRDSSVLVLTVLATVLAPGGVGQDEQPLRQLQAPDRPTRQRARHGIRKQHQELIAALIALAAGPTSPERRPRGRGEVPSYPDDEGKDLAIELLGDLRATEAIPVLLDNVKYCNPAALSGEYLPWQFDFPAAVSLAQIGNPSVEPALATLEVTNDELERQLCCWIIKEVEGEELAPIVLQLAIGKERYSGSKARLQAALEYLQKQK